MLGIGKKQQDVTESAPANSIHQLFIAGKPCPSANGAVFEDINPTTRQAMAHVSDATVSDMDAAIAAAHAAQPGWAKLPPATRAEFFYKAAEIFTARQQEFCDALIQETGSGFGKAMFECSLVPLALREAAGLTTRPIGEILPSNVPGKVNTAQRKPAGVVGVISPWNFPLYLSLRGFVYALALGNTAVIKPSEDSPLTGGLMIADLLAEAGFPAGTVNVVTCSRDNVAEVGSKLIDDPRVARVSFTGSTAVGREVAKACAAQFKRVILEMGGKNPIVVLDDADVDYAVSVAFFGAFLHQGQICMSVERVIVHEDIYDEFVEKFVPRVKKLTVGDSSKKENILGPVINDRAAERIKRHFDDAKAKGATVLAGGDIDGRFISPTVFANVTPDMLLYQEESFGPVCSIFKVGSDEEAVRLANDSEYGLTAGVMSEDEGRALAIVNKLDTGNCHVNCSPVNDEPHVPFGGFKASGLGKHGGKWSMETFTETRWITLDRGGRPFPPGF